MTFCQFQVQHGDCAKYCSSRRCIDRPCIQNVDNESLKINLKQNFILLTDILLSYTLKLNTLIYDMDSLSLNVGECRQLSRCSACLIWIEKSKFEFWLPHLGFVRGWCCSPSTLLSRLLPPLTLDEVLEGHASVHCPVIRNSYQTSCCHRRRSWELNKWITYHKSQKWFS